MSRPKIQVHQGQKVIVKTRSLASALTERPWIIRQGTISRVNGRCLEVEFVMFTGRLSFLNEKKWYDMADNGDTQQIVL